MLPREIEPPSPFGPPRPLYIRVTQHNLHINAFVYPSHNQSWFCPHSPAAINACGALSQAPLGPYIHLYGIH